ncbi:MULTISPECIES: oxidoreductase [unclassified Streptomyces]|uniref:DUF7544 domain-containing protein n=1 Tax=unclassified Streptomyces TaxID=2593676 RepID=UPI0016618194|nr:MULTISPECIES: oxidoreductase [unclassified Streptomyces]MBD0709236.1 oxidoreductase [Streptomyces sp. CBMA291]MBD0713567.1 oxidoreductase [Streptomyces sp. CBMA370]
MTIPAGPPYGYGYPPPPPPKPGVIPLAPLGLSEILTGAFATLGRYWKPLLGVAAAAYAGAFLVVAAAAGIAFAVVGGHLRALFDLSDDQSAEWADMGPVLGGFFFVWAVGMLALLGAATLVAAACPVVVQEAVLGRPATVRTVWGRTWARVPAVFGTGLLTGLLLLVPFALMTLAFVATLVTVADGDDSSPVWPLLAVGGILAFAPVAVWLWTKFAFAPVVAVMEKQGVIASMRRSSHLVRGSWWRVFGFLLAASVLASVITGIIQQALGVIAAIPMAVSDFGGSDTLPLTPLVVIGLLALVQVLVQGLASLFPPLVTSLLYVDQRIRRENLAADLARAVETPY